MTSKSVNIDVDGIDIDGPFCGFSCRFWNQIVQYPGAPYTCLLFEAGLGGSKKEVDRLLRCKKCRKAIK